MLAADRCSHPDCCHISYPFLQHISFSSFSSNHAFMYHRNHPHGVDLCSFDMLFHCGHLCSSIFRSDSALHLSVHLSDFPNNHAIYLFVRAIYMFARCSSSAHAATVPYATTVFLCQQRTFLPTDCVHSMLPSDPRGPSIFAPPSIQTLVSQHFLLKASPRSIADPLFPLIHPSITTVPLVLRIAGQLTLAHPMFPSTPRGPIYPGGPTDPSLMRHSLWIDKPPACTPSLPLLFSAWPSDLLQQPLSVILPRGLGPPTPPSEGIPHGRRDARYPGGYLVAGRTEGLPRGRPDGRATSWPAGAREQPPSPSYGTADVHYSHGTVLLFAPVVCRPRCRCPSVEHHLPMPCCRAPVAAPPCMRPHPARAAFPPHRAHPTPFAPVSCPAHPMPCCRAPVAAPSRRRPRPARAASPPLRADAIIRHFSRRFRAPRTRCPAVKPP